MIQVAKLWFIYTQIFLAHKVFMLSTVMHYIKKSCRTGRLPILVATEISRHGVMLYSLMQHESKQTSSVRHGSPDITLLLKQLVQLVPLFKK